MPIDATELARRLRAARTACGFTQEEIADRLGVSRPTLAQIEAGNRSVSSLELDKLAFLYGRDIRELLADSFREEDVLVALFRRHPDAARPGETIEALRGCLDLGRQISNLEHLLGIDRDSTSLPSYPARTPGTKWEAIQQGDRVAADERRRLGLGQGPLPDVAELLEVQGVRTAQVDLPEDLSGLALTEREVGLFVVANRRHPHLRRRFSFAHEYCHILLDRDQQGTISRAADRESLLEVRANAFAASFLMPQAGVEEFLAGLAKGAPSRQRMDLYDEAGAVAVQARPEPGSQRVQIYDIVLLAHHFGVSRQAALFRLKNLKLIGEPDFAVFKTLEEDGRGRQFAKLLALDDQDFEGACDEFRHRFLALGFEALRRGKITRGKLHELGRRVGADPDEIDSALEAAGVEELDDAPAILSGQD